MRLLEELCIEDWGIQYGVIGRSRCDENGHIAYDQMRTSHLI